MFNLFPKKKSVDEFIEDANLTPPWQWTPTQTPSMLQAQNELIEQFLKENHDLKLEKQKLKAELDKWEKDWDEQNKNVSELMKEINGLRHLKEENVKHLEYIKNLREQQDFLYQENEKLKKENLELIERVNEIDNDVIRDLKDEIFVLKNDYAVLKAQKHPMYPLHWMGLDPLIHEQAKDLTIEQAIDKVKEKSWEEAASDLALRVTKLEEQNKKNNNKKAIRL
jgi:hypothetical protein